MVGSRLKIRKGKSGYDEYEKMYQKMYQKMYGNDAVSAFALQYSGYVSESGGAASGYSDRRSLSEGIRNTEYRG